MVAASLASLAGSRALFATEPCLSPDRGEGTANLPPDLCHYQSEFTITENLPPFSTLEVAVILNQFVCADPNCETPGGTLGGSIHMFDGVLTLNLVGTGLLFEVEGEVSLAVANEIHSAPRTPGDPVQQFATDFFDLTGMLTNDPVFASLVVTAGANQGLPSPGSATFTDQMNGSFLVDNVFDMMFQFEFVGADGGPLEGIADTLTGEGPLEAVATPIFADGFESGDTSAWSSTQ